MCKPLAIVQFFILVVEFLNFFGAIVIRILVIFLMLLLQSCSEPASVAKTQQPVVVQLSEIQLLDIVNEYEFPATVSEVKSVDIKFEVTGRLTYANLVEGHAVSKGEVLARIDSAPFERQVSEAQIRFEDAVRNLKRVKEVFAKNVASQSALDVAKSQYALTELALANAKQDLSYCTIKAPFDGVVGARYIENNSYISAGTTIANLQDRSKLYFIFDVPERIMTANAGNKDFKATANIIGQEDVVFDIHYVEHETTPNSITQTYSVTFALDIESQPKNLFYPGSRATVKVLNNSSHHSALLVPINALIGDKLAGFTVWRFDEASHIVNPVKVNITSLRDDYAVVTSGLKAGDKVVSAGVNQMSDGLVVKAYKADY